MRQYLKPFWVYVLLLFFWGSLLVALPREPQPVSNSTATKSTKKPKLSVVDRYLNQMSLEEKLGQLFFARVPAHNQIADLQTYHLGGYILFARDMEGQSQDSLRATLASYQEATDVPLLIASDEEGGWVTRVSALLETPFQSPMTLYQSGGLPAVLEDTRSKADLLKSLGIHTGLYPVADVTTSSWSFIHDRTLGVDLEATKDYISQLVKVMGEEQFGSTLKHFPGYGDNGDTHTDIIYDERPRSQFEHYDFEPFRAGIAAGADSVLVSHNIVTAFDDVPASISPEVTKVLREELGFDGVIMTDDFDMAGLANFISQEEAAFAVLQAGNDLVMSSSYQTQIPYLLEKVKAGELSEERINQSVRRVLVWKEKLGLLN